MDNQNTPKNPPDNEQKIESMKDKRSPKSLLEGKVFIEKFAIYGLVFGFLVCVLILSVIVEGILNSFSANDTQSARNSMKSTLNVQTSSQDSGGQSPSRPITKPKIELDKIVNYYSKEPFNIHFEQGYNNKYSESDIYCTQEKFTTSYQDDITIMAEGNDDNNLNFVSISVASSEKTRAPQLMGEFVGIIDPNIANNMQVIKDMFKDYEMKNGTWITQGAAKIFFVEKNIDGLYLSLSDLFSTGDYFLQVYPTKPLDDKGGHCTIEPTENKPVDYYVNADQLLKEYQTNSNNAELKYDGKTIVVTGVITDIGKDHGELFAGQIFLNDNLLSEFSSEYIKSHPDYDKITKGDTIQVKCQAGATALLIDCTLLSRSE